MVPLLHARRPSHWRAKALPVAPQWSSVADQGRLWSADLFTIMNARFRPGTRAMTHRLLIAGGLLIAACYLAQLFGPLRMVDDGPLYLSGAVDLITGAGYREPRLPRGYPQALATLDVLGLNSPIGIVGLNLLSIAMGLVFIVSVIRSELGLSDRVCATVVLLTCSSWLWIYLAPVPMSEMVYFCLSSLPGGLIASQDAARVGSRVSDRGLGVRRGRFVRADNRPGVACGRRILFPRAPGAAIWPCTHACGVQCRTRGGGRHDVFHLAIGPDARVPAGLAGREPFTG